MRFQVRPKIINVTLSHGRRVIGDKFWLVCTKHLNGSTVVVPTGHWASVLNRAWKFLLTHSLFYSYQEALMRETLCNLNTLI